MLHCPNCGSTAQFRVSTPMYFEDGVWKQQKKCGCGCVVVLRHTEEVERIDYPKGADKISPLARSMIKAINKMMESK